MSKSTIVLGDLRMDSLRSKDRDFIVRELTGSIQYKIGETLSEQQVQDLCNMTGLWTVKIKHRDKK